MKNEENKGPHYFNNTRVCIIDADGQPINFCMSEQEFRQHYGDGSYSYHGQTLKSAVKWKMGRDDFPFTDLYPVNMALQLAETFKWASVMVAPIAEASPEIFGTVVLPKGEEITDAQEQAVIGYLEATSSKGGFTGLPPLKFGEGVLVYKAQSNELDNFGPVIIGSSPEGHLPKEILEETINSFRGIDLKQQEVLKRA